MKKLLSIMLALVLLLSLAACGQTPDADVPDPDNNPVVTPDEGQTDPEPEPEPEPEPTADALVVYFSASGNTRAAATTLAGMQGADLYEIVPVEPYTDEDLNYNDRSTRATVEQNDPNARPEITAMPENLDSYDTIYVGFPIWWGDMPRILYTFFDGCDLSGKTIAPFCTSGGSGISRAVESIRGLEPSATVTDGLKTSASSAEGDFAGWLGDIGLAE